MKPRTTRQKFYRGDRVLISAKWSPFKDGLINGSYRDLVVSNRNNDTDSYSVLEFNGTNSIAWVKESEMELVEAMGEEFLQKFLDKKYSDIP